MMAGRQKIGDLYAKIGADTKDLSRGIGRAKAMFRGLARTAKVAGVAATASFAAASAGMVMMTRQGLSFVDSQAKAARSVDGTIDGLRALQIAASDNGVEMKQLNKAAQEMGKRIAEAARDGFGPAYEALEMLGLSASELMEMDVDQRFAAFADRAQELGMNAQQAGDLLRQFGIRGSELSLLMIQGGAAIRAARGEVEKFGLSVSQDMAAQVEQANDAMSRIGFVFEGMRNQLAAGLAPALQTIAVNLQDASVAGGPLQTAVANLTASFSELAQVILDPAFIEAATLFGTTIAGGITTLANVLVVLTQNAEIAGTAMIALGAAMKWFMGPIGLAISAVSAGVLILSTRLGDSATAADTAERSYQDLQAALDLVDRGNREAVASGEALINTHIDQARAAVEAAKAEYALARAAAQRDLNAAEAMASVQPEGWGQIGIDQATEDLQNANDFYAAEIEKAEANLTRLQKTLEGFQRSQVPSRGIPAAPGTEGGTPEPQTDPLGVSTLNQELLKLINVIDPAAAKTERLKQAMTLLTKAKAEGLITDEEYLERAKQVNEVFGATPEVASAASAGIRAISREMAKTKAASDETREGWERAFGNLIQNIDRGRSALSAFAIEAAKMLAIRGISRILGGSAWFDGPLIGANANGTDNWRGGLSWVGERGPELVNLPRGAQVIPNNKIGGMGGGVNLVYAPKNDMRGASLAAVQEMEQRQQADAATFKSKVHSIYLELKSEGKI